MVNREDPSTWTKEYVSSHHADCLAFLRDTNLLTIRYSQQDNALGAITALDRILDGLVALQNAKCGEYRSFLSSFSMVEGVLLISLGPAAIPNAIKALKDARDFAQKPGTRQHIEAILAPLEKGTPVDRLEPHELVWLLEEMDQHPLEAMPNPDAGGGYSPPATRPVQTADPKFEQWVEDCGWDEEDLEQVYKKVKLRRNLYGLSLLFVPLGILLSPFWLRAVYLTKMIRYRDTTVDFSLPTKIVMVLYFLPTLFIYPLIMLQIIKWSNWGMGLGDRRALIPTVAVLVLAGFLVISTAAPNLPSIGELAAIPGQMVSEWRGNRAPSSQPPVPESAPPASEPEPDGNLHEATLRGWRLRIRLPQDWEDLCNIYTDSFTMTFLQKATREADGLLFFLTVTQEDFGEIGVPHYRVVAQQDDTALIAVFPTDVQFDESAAEEYAWLYEQIPEILTSVEFERAYPDSCPTDPDASDQDLLALAKEAYYEILRLRRDLYSGWLLPHDEYDYITIDENGAPAEDGWPCYRVPGCTNLDELRAALEEVWYQSFSRKYPLEQDAVHMYLEYNGAVYVMEYGMGDEGGSPLVDDLIFRTDDEAVFSGHVEFGPETTGEFQFSLVFEDGRWKYGFLT